MLTILGNVINSNLIAGSSHITFLQSVNFTKFSILTRRNMWWGYSEPLDLQNEITQRDDQVSSNLEVLIVGAGDARHIVKTLASSYVHSDRIITYHVIEPTLEQVARSILLLNICLQKDLEILGNTLLRPATAKYLAKCTKQLVDISTCTIDCPWLSLEKFKYKERDNLECIFKFWTRATREGVPIINYWDRRIRKSLKTRYDYREGVFDWDYYMVLKPKGIFNLTIQEYRFWRNNGVAFTWLEGEPVRSNPTLLNNIIQYGSGFLHYTYLGDIVNGPFFTWAANERKDKMFRATDIAEGELMRTIYEIKTKEPLCEDYIGAHRDPSILNGTIVTEMPDIEMELESWTNANDKTDKEKISWIEIPNHKIIFHSASSLELLKSKCEYVKKFHLIWVAHNMTKQLENLVPLASTDASIIVELRKYMTELHKEDLQNFNKELSEIVQKNGLRSVYDFNSNEHTLARLYKN
ncbi:dynein assembly factor 3, axonemal homolog isoform X2 [Odontomachus brunneus]|uniref:dynein assembly factor 3, axonemal homolog isoform X2 n=1 Tax=Odontomachus brunneus TaxID=486640 RepID=UPI0013F2158C|nr:dynein assembly factor 3, axonemal homolog isoform X2 [Odontomachus brunneus]